MYQMVLLIRKINSSRKETRVNYLPTSPNSFDIPVRQLSTYYLLGEGVIYNGTRDEFRVLPMDVMDLS